MLVDIPHQQLNAVLEDTAAEILGTAGVVEPPVDALQVANALGLLVAWDAQQPGRARCVELAGDGGHTQRAAVLLRPELRSERKHWAVAHEIGELWASEVFCRLGIDPVDAPGDAREQVANRMAARILLPRDWFSADARQVDWELSDLKERYATASHELIARRMLDFPPRVIITIFDQGRQTMRRSNVRGRVPPVSALERACWNAANAQGQTQQRCGPLSDVRAWPIHEPHWKREILRTTAESIVAHAEHETADEG